MDVSTGGKAGRQSPIEHGRVPRVLTGHKEHHGLSGQRDLFAFAGHADDCDFAPALWQAPHCHVQQPFLLREFC
jgi:hypothetical protein